MGSFDNKLWQSPEWIGVQTHLGAQVVWLNGVHILVKKLPWDKTYLEIQRMPVRDQSFWQEVKKLGKKHDSIFVRFSGNTDSDHLFPDKACIVADPHFPDATRVIDLKMNLEEIRAQMSQSGRRHLKKAESKNLLCSESVNLQKWVDFIHETGKRQGFAAHGLDYFQTFFTAFGDAARLLVIKNQAGQWLSAGIFVFHGKTATYYYGASSAAANDAQAPTLLQWQAIELAKKHKCEWYDFLGVAPPDAKSGHRLSGVSRFKQKFGGEVVIYPPEQTWTLQPLWCFLYRSARFFSRFLKK